MDVGPLRVPYEWPGTGRLSTVADGLALGARRAFLAWCRPGASTGWWVGRSGAVYVSGDKANVLYRLD
jgi:hypothetical protein